MLTRCVSAAAIALLPGCAARRGRPAAFHDDPFTLGVASGSPTANEVVLWTRLALDPLVPDGGLPRHAVPVRWELAADEKFRRIVRSQVASAAPADAHSLHVVAPGLEAGRPYWYRFIAGGIASPVGRTATAPAMDSQPASLRIAVASCQHYEQGLYVAYRHLVDDEPDLVVHLGDYIYETAAATGFVRSHGTPECMTLDDYRVRYGLYRSDPLLQAAHAACPWLVTWDDHEVDNDYADDVAELDENPQVFLARRAAAYRAYYEHMPLPPRARPSGSSMQLYGERTFGGLANVFLLDERQYRSPHACPPPGRRGARLVHDCAELALAGRSKLGAQQDAWLARRLGASRTRWNLIAQGTLMAYLDEEPGAGTRFWSDSSNGYPWARQQLMNVFAAGVRNPVVLSGDIHAFIVSGLHATPGDPTSALVATELTTTSISSRGLPQERLDAVLPENPHVLLARTNRRGYLRLDVRRDELKADLVVVDSVADPAAGRSVLASFVIETDRPVPVRRFANLRQVQATPAAAGSLASETCGLPTSGISMMRSRVASTKL